jgi:hypothetical protein
MALAAEIVNRLEVRKGTDGINRYVYRTADGTEFEGVCAPEGVRDILAKLGVKMPLKEVRRLLGLAQGVGVDAGTGEAKEKKGRKAKTAEKDDIKAILWRHKWVVWRGALWLVATPKLLKVDLDLIHGLLKQEGVDVGKETLKSYLADILTDLPKDPLEGLVVTPAPIYGKVGNLRGLWFSHRGDLHLVTPTERRVFLRGQWPDGVYALDTGLQAVLPDWEGEPIHLLKYWEGITPRFEGNPKVALAMYLPVLFGQGDIGLILRGPAKSGKSTLLRAMAYLHLGRKPNTPSGSVNMRDIIAVLHRRQIAFFDEVNTFSPELQETLKRMITHDGAVMRALYTDFETVETELSGSAVFCTTNLEKLATDLRTRCFVWDLREKKGGVDETEILEFCRILWRKALAGAIKLYQQAAQLKPPPKNLLPQVRFRDWLSWAYRYAVVLGVADEFVAYVAKSKRAAHRGDKYEFLLDAILHPNFDPNKEYTIGDLLSLTSLPPSDAKGIKSSINREGVRSDMIALALDAGYNLRIEKGRDDKDRKLRYMFIFSPIEASTSDHLREILESLGIKPDLAPDWDGDVALPAEPLPQNGHSPMPEVHTPPPASRIAPPVPEPGPVAAQSGPADVGGGDLFEAPNMEALAPAIKAYLRASDEITNILTHLEDCIVEPKEPELLLIIGETLKGVKKLRELFPLLRERDGDNIDALTLGYRTLYACMWGHMSILCGLATFRGLSLEGQLPHPKVGWAVVRRVLQELEGVLKGEEVSLWPLPEPRKPPTDHEPTPPPIEPEPKWREAWELFAQIPPGHPARLAILKGFDPDPLRDWEYHTKHRLIRALLNGEAIDPPSKPPKNP